MRMRILSVSLLIALISLTLSGCGGSSKEISSGFSGEPSAGANINLTATSGTLSFGGTSLIAAAVRDASGEPVPAALLATQATFASRLGGTFSSPPVANNGLITVRYTAPTAEALKGDLIVNDEITVMYAGAIARITILLKRLY
jgi:hypothetical protein